jgi:glycosyltransferase involved in cell wall biosynthesis
MQYTALIRTFNSEKTLGGTLRSLESQSCPPAHYVIVDSGSSDATLTLAPPNSTVIKFAGPKFNYSSAINQGVKLVRTGYVMVISSHTALMNTSAVQYALSQLETNPRLGAAYFCHDEGPEPAGTEVDIKTFNGVNGVWNTSSLLRTDLVRRRSFRPEVFSAEDQEWSMWLLENTPFTILRISGAGLKNNNPLGYPLKKRLDEHESIALFTKPGKLTPAYLLRVAYRVVQPISSVHERWFNLLLLGRLLRHI